MRQKNVDRDKHVGYNKDTSFILNTLRSHLRIMTKSVLIMFLKIIFVIGGNRCDEQNLLLIPIN